MLLNVKESVPEGRHEREPHDARQSRWRRRLARSATGVVGLALACALLSACGGSSGGSESTAQKPVAVDRAPTAPFDPNVKPGPKPDLPRRIGWALPAGGELFTGFDNGVRTSAKAVGLEYLSVQSNADSPKQFQATQDMLARGVGALIIADLSPPTLVPLQRRAIDRGAAVFCGPFAVCTSSLTLEQYDIGYRRGVAAARWIEENLGGRAEVVLFIQEQLAEGLRRARGTRDGLKTGGPGIRIVTEVHDAEAADVGFRTTNTVLQKYPDVKVWLGGDSMLAGTLAALRAAGKADESALFGVDGSAQALNEIKKGGPYKATEGIPWGIVAYAWGRYASDWLDGKSIPQVMQVGSVSLDSPESVEAFEQALASPGESYADNQRTGKYFKPLGNVSYGDNKYLTVIP